MGWIGPAHQLKYVLQVMEADRDENGNFKIYGSEPVSFLGLGEEYVIDENCCYSINGQYASLSGALNSTSYGHKINVIC